MFLCLIIIISCKTIHGWPSNTSEIDKNDWTGIWFGVVEGYPKDALGVGWNVTWEIGSYPMIDHHCTTWRIVYRSENVIQLEKNNEFCRGNDSNDLYIRDKNGGKAAVQWIDDVLTSAFKSQGSFAIARMKMHKNILEEEILLTDDKPAMDNVVVSLRTLSFHSIKMKRMSFHKN
ncbi:unnamed protein product [Adineta ricciae]|uniref:Uncharacterized protein n=1 Tax=Adineta ricciae TaxID=249248 RepID=A0A815V5T3_ADIRI|nr:unnamed protein product [Adineta ricciae]